MNWALPTELLALHNERLKALQAPKWQSAMRALQDLVPTDEISVRRCAEALCPWKKGPFNFTHFSIDAEWDCSQKWQRLSAHLGPLANKNVLDVGTGNGWYLQKIRDQGADRVWGFDPGPLNFIQWSFLQKMRPDDDQKLWLLGVEELKLLPKTFDVIFHMGVLYHHRDPMMQLIDLREALKPTGELWLETIGVPGNDNTLYLPDDRYAGMPNVWFLPTLKALTTMLTRARFSDIEVLATHWGGIYEQRPTTWAPGPSYAGALDPDNSQRTIEGHPAPERFLVRARRKGIA